VIALVDVRRQLRGLRVRLGCGVQVASQLVQVRPHRMPAVAIADHIA